MEIDATVNMTVEVDEVEWESFLDQYREEDEDGEPIELENPEQYLDEFVDEILSGEEIQGYYGRAWVCSVDDCSIL